MKRLLLIICFIVSLSALAQAQNHSDRADLAFNFYPNPATSTINFDFQKGSSREYVLFIFDFLGNKKVELHNLMEHNTVDLSNLPRGMYIFQIKDIAGHILASSKFQVSK